MNEHRAGPLRSAAARESILAATAKMFQEVGYEQLTIEGIAKQAGVGKQTIYRWWGSKSALVADVEAWVSSVTGILVSHNGESLLRSLVAAAAEDAEIGDRLTTSLGVDRQLAERLRIGIREGQLPDSAPADELGAAIMGAIILQVLSRNTDYEAPLRRLVRFILART